MSITRKRFLLAASGVGAVTSTACQQTPSRLWRDWMAAGSKGPAATPGGADLDLFSHALNRLAFGPRPGDYGRIRQLAATPEAAFHAYLERQLGPSQIDDSFAQRLIRRTEALLAPTGELFEYKPRFLHGEMTRDAVLRAVYSERQLYEVMVGFWTDHFNIDSSKGDCKWLKAADDRDVIRKHALGRFRDLLAASALSPAMLWYLDGRVNRKSTPTDKPNENYARELLELHTLGVHGGYTQQDVMEVARCLTGWTVRPKEGFRKGRVEFHPEAHDDGAKLVLGQTIPASLGKADLDRVLDIAAGHPSTQLHLATKLCRRFIADDPPQQAVAVTSAAFQRSGGSIPETLRALFGTPEFLNARGTRLKRPFEFMVSALRSVSARVEDSVALAGFLQRMGHAPFEYPTPDGYSDQASAWMGTFLWRWNFSVALSEGRVPGVHIDRPALLSSLGGEEKLIAHMLGRLPTQDERDACVRSGNSLGLLLASPAFQRR